MCTGNVFTGGSNRVYPVSRWNIFSYHRRDEFGDLYHVPNRNLLGIGCDELYPMCTGDIFDVDWQNDPM